MEDSFYVTLSSNVNTEYYPDNKLTHFFNRLHTPLHLHNRKWLVGLAEIQCPFNWKQVQEGECAVSLRNQKTLLRELVTLPTGHYSKSKDIIQQLNIGVKNLKDGELKNGTTFRLDKFSGRANLYAKDYIQPAFSPKLSRILGFETEMPTLTGSKFIGHDVVDIHDGLHHLFVYTNLIEARPVGDTIAPLLRVIPVDHEDKIRNKIKSFNNIHYQPVRRQIFESVEIDIRDGTGEFIPFERGNILVTLHFKPQHES